MPSVQGLSRFLSKPASMLSVAAIGVGSSMLWAGDATGKTSFKGLGQYLGTLPGDPTSMESSASYRFLEGTFGGSNLLMNLAAGMGGHWASNRMKNRAFATTIKENAMRRKGFHYGEGAWYKFRPNSPYGQVPDSMVNRYLSNRNPNSQILQEAVHNPKAAYASLQKSMPNMRDSDKLRKLGASDRSIAGLKMANRLKRVANLAAWAPIAFMAFDMVGSLSNLPAPEFEPMQRKSASLSGTFIDTSMAYTQRRRALQAMHNSQYVGRAALSNEAALMHK